MSDFLGGLFNSQSCQADGSVGMNPVNQMLDHLVDSMNSFGGVTGMTSGSASEMMMMPDGSHSNGIQYGQDFSFMDHGHAAVDHGFSHNAIPDSAASMGGGSQQLFFNPSNSLFPMHHNMAMGLGMMPMTMPMMPPMYGSEFHRQQFVGDDLYAEQALTEEQGIDDEVFVDDYGDYDFQESGEDVNEEFDFKTAMDRFQTDMRHSSADPTISREGYQQSWERTLENLLVRPQEPTLQQTISTSDSDYQFAAANPLISSHDTALDATTGDTFDVFERGMELFRAGQIAAAIESFEAQLQRGPDHTHADSWHMLGSCHAENDEDKRAIVCYQRALDCDPYHLEALLSAGISYVNELDSLRALESLKAWVTHNPRFQDIAVELDEYSDGTLMDEVMQLMLAVGEQEQRQALGTGSDVKVVLGVLYNVSTDYDAAAECFQQVVAQRPEDYGLLNKLAATLANSNQSAQALQYYDQALALRPKYARGWLNKGISFANLNQYEPAAKAYIMALQLNPNAKHIWSYLRIVLTCLDRLDLVELAGKEDIEGLARGLRAVVAPS